MSRALSFVALATLAVFIPSSAHSQLVRSGTGAAATVARDAFRVDLGGGTLAGANGSFGGVRREINWDGVPDALAAPNNLPADFFNVNSPRGVVFSTPGTGLQVSANAGQAEPPLFQRPDLFAAFSPQRLFTAVGSNIVDVNFFIPGTTTAALTRGFGAIFSDVDLANTTSIQFFDVNGASLGTFFAEAVAGANQTFSFLGVSFATPIISKVRITSGNAALAFTNESPTVDYVVMDDFIYGEPGITATPEPATLGLFATGLSLLGSAARRRRKTSVV